MVDSRASLRRFQRLADLETGLLGLLHFYRTYGRFLSGTTLDEVRASRWYFSALITHADMLFTVDKGGDTQRGAALRAFRDLDRLDLLADLEGKLAQPATGTGVTLGSVIRRLRNEVLVHHSFDLEEQGSALLHLGSPDDLAAIAFEGLVDSVDHALVEIANEKLHLTEETLSLGVDEVLADISAAPERARKKEQERRRAQRTQQKKPRGKQ